MNFLRQLDYNFFRLINGRAGQNRVLDYFGIFCAVYLIWLMAIAALAFFWFLPVWINHSEYLFVLFGSMAFSYVISNFVGLLYGRARPFVGLYGLHRLIVTSFSRKSFPSAHATVAFAIAFSVFWFAQPLGIVFLVLAALVALGRVFTGVHYPLDVLGGAFFGGVMSFMILKIWF